MKEITGKAKTETVDESEVHEGGLIDGAVWYRVYGGNDSWNTCVLSLERKGPIGITAMVS